MKASTSSPPSSTICTTVTIVGGGSSAHILIPFLSMTHKHTVNLLTRRPTAWSKHVTTELHSMNDDILDIFEGSLHRISNEPSDVIPEADLIIFCMPVHQYRNALHRIAPFINRNKYQVFVGTIYGQAGFNWMVHEMEKTFCLTNTVCFAVGLIPWICRTVSYGSKAVNYGCKELNVVAVTPRDRFDCLNEIFLDDICHRWLQKGQFVQACSFLSLTLSVDNQIIHPARCYGIWKVYHGKSSTGEGYWDKAEDVPLFYRDFDETSATILKQLDNDYTKIRNAVRTHFPSRPFTYMLDYLSLHRLTHQNEHEDILESFHQSKQLGLIKTPTRQCTTTRAAFSLDTDSRFFTDDIPYGLLVAKWVAENLQVEVPTIDEVIMWAQTLTGETFIRNNGSIDLDACLRGKFTSGIPPSYGIEDVDRILD